MNATIDRYAYATVDASPDGRIEFHALDHDESGTWSVDEVPHADGSLRLMAGAFARVVRDFLGGRAPAVRIRTYSDAPPGSGLGSWSTMMVAIVTALAEYFSLGLGEYEVAHLAFEIERRDLGLSGGKQDQYAAAFGGFNFMEFHADDRVIVNPLRIKPWVSAELEASLLLYFTGVSRASATIIDEQIRNVESGESKSLDAMHRLKEEAVTMKEALLKGDLRRFAEALQAGWLAKKQMASSINNARIDAIERIATANGAQATKVSGAGGGGFVMFFCAPHDRVRLSRALLAEGGSILDFHFTAEGATAWRPI
jgi:D-glycero-alpha-D-manno-heptose-7-phosphate kinase